MAAVFLGLHLAVLGTECEVLWFFVIGRMLPTLRSAFYLEDLHFLVAAVIKKVVRWF